MTTTHITNNLLRTVARNNFVIARNASSATLPDEVLVVLYAVLAIIVIATLTAVLWISKAEIEYFFWDIQYRRKLKKHQKKER